MGKQVRSPKSMTGPKRETTRKFTTEWKAANNSNDEDVGWKSLQGELWYNSDKNTKVTKKLNASTTQWTYTIDRKAWYPVTNNKLNSISVSVTAIGKNGSGSKESKTVSINFEEPKNPSCTFEYDDTTGLLLINCTAPTHDKKDKYDCVYRVYRQDIKTESSRYKDGKKKYALNTNAKEMKGTTTKTEFTLKTNVEQLYLVSGSKITFEVQLTSRGFVGDTTVTKKFTVMPPLKVSIKKIDISNGDNLDLSKNTLYYKSTTGSVRVFYYGNASANYNDKSPTDFSLQRLITSYDVNRAVEAAVMTGWEEVDTNMGSSSDSKIKKKVADGVMGEPTVNVLTAMGFNNNAKVFDVRVWYRIKSTRQGMSSYSAPFECKELASPVPSAKNDYSGFMALRNSTKEPGTSIDGVVGWDNADNNDEGVNNKQWKDAIWTTMVEWSEHRYANRSNNKPNELEITWKYSMANHGKAYANYVQRVKNGEFGKPEDLVPWSKSAFFSIYGLTPGTKYYLWTRRHMVLGEYDEYGPRTPAPAEFFPFTPIDNPSSVQVYTEENYIYGRDLLVSWTHDATCDQKTWSIYVIPYKTKYKEGVTLVKSIPKKLVACGTGTINSYKVSAGNLDEIQPVCTYVNANGDKKYFTIKKKLGIVVGVSTGGKEILSCSDDRGRFIGANYLDIGHIPVGKLGFMISGGVTENYSIECTGGYSGTDVVLDFKSTTNPKADTITINLVRVYCKQMVHVSNIDYKITVSDSKKVLSETVGTLESKPYTSEGNKQNTIKKFTKSVTVTDSKAIVSVEITGGNYKQNGTKVTIPRSSGAAKATKTVVRTASNMAYNTKQPLAYLFSRTTTVTGSVSVFAVYDTAYNLPDGEHMQPAGECVFTKRVATSAFGKVEDVLSNAEKTYFNSVITGKNRYPYVARINVYSHRKMFDGSTYVIQGFLRDTYDDELVSDSMVKTFTYKPNRQARVCGKGTRIEGTSRKLIQSLEDATQSKGHGLTDRNLPPSPSVEIYVDRPTNYDVTDRYDIYRITPDGGVLIAKDRKFNGTRFVDRYAPYSNDQILRYAIVTVTAGGDFAWREIRYSLKHMPGIRFDWGSIDNQRALELPLDIEINDSYGKDVRIDTYMDGSVAAYFNKAITRTSTAKAKLVKCDFTEINQDPLKYAMVRELARYAGPVFFRADNGVAYECVVEVDGLDYNYDSLTSQVSFKITEINPPSNRFSSTMKKRTTKKFNPSSVGQVPSGTSSPAEKLSTPTVTKSQAMIKDHLIMDYVSKNQTKKRWFSVDSDQKYDDVTIFYYQTITSTQYQFGFPALEINMKKAINKKLASGTIGGVKNSYSVFLKMEVLENQQVLKEHFWYYGTMGGSVCKTLVHSEELDKKPYINVNRKKIDRTIKFKTTVYLVRDKSDDVEGTIILPAESPTDKTVQLHYSLDSNPSGTKPKAVHLKIKKITTTHPGYYGVTVSSVPYGASGYSSSKKYYDSGTIYIEGKSKAINKTVGFTRKESTNSSIYINFFTTNGNFTKSKKVIIKSFDDIVNLHTNIANPHTETIIVKSK